MILHPARLLDPSANVDPSEKAIADPREVMKKDPESSPPTSPGLCGRCQHVRLIKSARGSTFLMCKLSKTDPAYSRYPQLPVLQCHGFQPTKAEAAANDGDK